MTWRLFCDADPRALGIERAEGDWDLDALAAHIRQCPVCRIKGDLLRDDLAQGLDETFDAAP